MCAHMWYVWLGAERTARFAKSLDRLDRMSECDVEKQPTCGSSAVTLDGADMDLIEGMIREAEVAAARLCAFLKVIGWPTIEVAVPIGLALNLSAGLRINDWDEAGFSENLGGHLPRGCDAVLDMLKASVGPRPPRSREGGEQPLYYSYLKTWITRFAWAGRLELGVDVVIDGPTKLGEGELEAIADFIWSSRHSNAK